MSDHARLPPSSSARWLACPASAAESLKVVTPDTEYSVAGTARHVLSAMWLTTGSSPEVGAPIPGMDGLTVTADMVNDVAPGVDWVLREYRPRTLFVEERVSIGGLFGLDPEVCWGTVDVLGLQAGELLVMDHKFGRVTVPVADNPQLMLYAAGAMDEMGWLWPQTRLVINQPRGEGIVEHVVSADDLRAWVEKVTPAVRAAASDGAAYVPGEEQCRYCPAAGVCRALQEQTLALAKQEFSQPAHLGLEQLAEILDKAPVIEAAIKGAREHALKLALAGQPVPGWKVVESKKHRVWVDEVAAQARFRALGFNEEDFAPRRMVSPAQAEKMAGQDAVASLITTPRGEPVLAPVTDKRPEYKAFSSLADVAGMLE
jgi:hypothetical protein